MPAVLITLGLPQPLQDWVILLYSFTNVANEVDIILTAI